jgi:hypothetical protein
MVVFLAVSIGVAAWVLLVVIVLGLCRAAAKAERGAELEVMPEPSRLPVAETTRSAVAARH